MDCFCWSCSTTQLSYYILRGLWYQPPAAPPVSSPLQLPFFSLSFSSFPSDTLPPSQAACIPVSSSLCSTSSSSSHLPPPPSPLPCPLSAHDVSVQAFQQIIIISCNQTRSWHQ